MTQTADSFVSESAQPPRTDQELIDAGADQCCTDVGGWGGPERCVRPAGHDGKCEQ